MKEAKEKIVNCCEALLEKIKDAEISGNNNEKIAAIKNNAREQQLVVPVVGAFSSGKSTMINSLIGNDILPVGIKPETSLATELRYSPENFILAVKENGETDRYKIEDIKTVTENAANYLYAQIYLNNEKLREIEPLVLVDMPGFDSPLDLHNKAIMAYLDRGCYYIVLSNVEEGTITKSLERRLHEIESFKRDFSFFLSKANLRPQDSIDSLVAHYQEQISNKFECKAKVLPLGMEADSVLNCLKNIDSDKVLLKLYRDILMFICNDIISDLNLQIKSSAKDSQKLQNLIEEMKNSIEKLRKKADSDIEEMRARYSGMMVNDIVADVGDALENSIDELSGIAITGNQEAVTRHLNEIVRSALIASIREKLNLINKQISIDFSESIQDLDRIMKELDLDENYLVNITGKVETALKMIDDMLISIKPQENEKTMLDTLESPGGRVALNLGFKTLAGAGLASSVINPIIGIIIMFLPEIIKGLMKLFGADPKEKQREEICVRLSGEVFPSIKRKLRDDVPEVLEEHITVMIENAREQFETQIKNQEETINKQIEKESTNISEKEAIREKLETAKSGVQEITNQVMSWE